MGTSRPRIALFVSQDDQALKLSKTIWGGVQRLGEIDPSQEPYHSELEAEHIEVFDLTKLKGNAHSRAFEDITTVMMMIKDRVGESFNRRTLQPRGWPRLVASINASSGRSVF